MYNKPAQEVIALSDEHFNAACRLIKQEQSRRKLNRAPQHPTPKSGVYETTYGNACAFKKRRTTAFDIDMQERIPLEQVDFTKFIRKLDMYDKIKA